jgi:CBS-domain-containing membrane protein
MGASAVLLFAVPHSALAQPWSLVGGHLLSAFIGVSCALLISPPALAAAAVGLAIGAMYYLVARG